MTTREMQEFFKSHNSEFLKFTNIPASRRISSRPDMNAFLLLDRITPGDCDIVCSASHDEIWLDPDHERVAELATQEQLLDLIRCGVMFHGEGFQMFA